MCPAVFGTASLSMTNPSSPAAPALPPRRRGRWVVLGGVALGLAGLLAAWLWTGDAERAVAVQDCRGGQFARAEPALKAVLARHPDDAEVLDCLARGYLAAGRPLDAEPYLSDLVRLHPDSAEYLRLRWNMYRELKRWEPAYADARRLVELQPDDEDLRRKAMGEAYMIGRFADAEELCRKLLASHPGDRKLLTGLAEFRRSRGDDQGAGQILDELIRTDPNDYGALQARGILYDETGRPEQAVPLLRRVFAEDPTRRRPAGYVLGMALAKIGQPAESENVLAEVRRLQELEFAREAVKTQPNNLDLKVRLAERLMREGSTADGLRLLTEVLRTDPGHAGAHRVLAAHFERTGQPDLAAEHRRLAGGVP
jgi:predicted Zn-dependent protease